MPYINSQARKEIDDGATPQNAGQLNYALHKVIEKYISAKGKTYQVYNDVIGALKCTEMELYRRSIAPYEDEKIRVHGDIDIYQPKNV